MSSEKKPNIIARLARWFRETRSELKRVVWPTRKQLINNTAIVLCAVIAVGIVMAGLDAGFLMVIHRFFPFVFDLF
ncbi:MAG: preprotein translocase subunit SecE [Oscillospiraceae bacterium]|nr:preprotein translocase subunit SecE [Oscillospiraceae bacterium]